MKMFPTPLFLSDGSRCDHMMRTGRPLITSKFMVSRARSAKGEKHRKRRQGYLMHLKFQVILGVGELSIVCVTSGLVLEEGFSAEKK